MQNVESCRMPTLQARWTTARAQNCMSCDLTRALKKLLYPQLIKKFPAFWNPKFRFDKIPPLLSIVSHMNPAHALHSYFIKFILISCILLLGLPGGIFPSVLPTKTLHAFIFSPTRAACPAHLTFFDFITLIVSGADPSGRAV